MKNKILNQIKLSNKITLSKKSKTFIVAEISGNHNGNINNIFKSIDLIKKAGGDAIKIQSYEPNTITVNSKKKYFFIKDKSIWKGQYLYDLYKSAHTPFSWHKKIFKYAQKKNLFCFSSPFDLSSLKLLENLDCPIYKVASPEIQDLELIDAISKTKKPIIISTGIADQTDIKLAIKQCLLNKNNKIILLNCISSYPAKNEELNLSYIDKLKDYTPLVGYSDHSQGNLASIISVAMGAKILEKHFTISKRINSADRDFSISSNNFFKYVQDIRETETMLGKQNVNKKKILKQKLTTITRSLFYARDLKKKDLINRSDILSIRPGSGLSPQNLSKIIGKRIKKNVKKNTPVKKHHI